MHSNCNGFEGGVQVRNAGEERGLKGEPVRAGNLRKGAIAEEGPPRPTGFGEVAARYRGARHSRVGAADPVYFSRSRQLRLFSGGSFVFLPAATPACGVSAQPLSGGFFRLLRHGVGLGRRRSERPARSGGLRICGYPLLGTSATRQISGRRCAATSRSFIVAPGSGARRAVR